MYDYVLKVAQKWVSAPYNVDGWRLDVAADLGQTILSNGGITWLDKKYTYGKMNFWGYTFYGVTSGKNYL